MYEQDENRKAKRNALTAIHDQLNGVCERFRVGGVNKQENRTDKQSVMH
jgi:hypothetical protein